MVEKIVYTWDFVELCGVYYVNGDIHNVCLGKLFINMWIMWITMGKYSKNQYFRM